MSEVKPHPTTIKGRMAAHCGETQAERKVRLAAAVVIGGRQSRARTKERRRPDSRTAL